LTETPLFWNTFAARAALAAIGEVNVMASFTTLLREGRSQARPPANPTPAGMAIVPR
jgi:hypothetical protein